MTPAERGLMRLARLAGVAPVFRDAWQELRRVPAESLRAILAAMGVDASTPSGVDASCEMLEREEWNTLLPPVATTVAGPAAAVPITVSTAAGTAFWRLRLESGEQSEGSSDLETLTVIAERREHGARHRRLALPIDRSAAPGYHRLSVTIGDIGAETLLVVCPRRCYLPPALSERRSWALTAQLYALRSARNWGIGDFTDLAALAIGAARQGASALGINPLHALFPAEPRHISPYSPSSRQFINPLYLDVAAMPDFAAAAMAPPALEPVRSGDLIDYPRVAALKRSAFEACYRRFAEHHLGAAMSARGEEFRRFQREGGRALESFAIFTALHEQMLSEQGAFSWHQWPAPLRQSDSPEVARFAAAHRERVELHQYLQWECDRQLGAAGQAAAAGLSVGLYRDLAVGVDPAGADAWTDPGMMVAGASVGAPPDLLNMKGQDWGLAPVNPVALKRQGFAPFIAALRANMRHAGLLRIDHVMALMHLYWVPRGASPAEGAYVTYPFSELRHILALESERQRCAVIGEDLGTVPDGFREIMTDAGILSYRLLLFERDRAGGFLPPGLYPEQASAAFSTHDLATLKGFWLGRDLEWRRELNLYPDAESGERERSGRRIDRKRLIEALVAAGALPRAAAKRLLPKEDRPVYEPELAEAVQRFLASSKSRLVLMQIEDVLGELEQANLPGTVDQHPNWRRRLGLAIDLILDDPRFRRLAAVMREAREAS